MKRVLAIKNRRLGDTVLWTSALQALVDSGFSVDLLYPRKYHALFKRDPRFQRQYFVEETLPSDHYDAALCFHASPSMEKLTRQMDAGTRVIHFHSREPLHPKGTLQVPYLGKPMRATERDLNVVRALGWSGKAPPTRLYSTKAVPPSEKARIFFGPEASRPSKEWPLEYYVELAARLHDRYSLSFFAENAQKVAEDPRYRALQKFANHLHTPHLEDVLDVMQSATIYVGSDSGLKHIAVALGLRTVTLFGPESIGEWHCYDGQTALQIPVACRDQDPLPVDFAWCGAEHCPLASHACLRLIRPEDVVKVL